MEDEIISNALIYEFSDSNIPTILVKSEIIESEEPITKISEPKPQEIEEITMDHSEIVHEINLEANELEVIDSDVEKVETCVQNQQKLTEEKRTQLLNSWYDQSIEADVYKDELNLEDNENIVLDESVYNTEIKLEDKKSFLNDEVLKQKRNHFTGAEKRP